MQEVFLHELSAFFRYDCDERKVALHLLSNTCECDRWSKNGFIISSALLILITMRVSVLSLEGNHGPSR